MAEITHVWINETKYISDNIINSALSPEEAEYWARVREAYALRGQIDDLTDSLGDKT